MVSLKPNIPPIPPKYKSADGLQIRNGLGPRPQWIKDEIAKGRELSDLLINKP